MSIKLFNNRKSHAWNIWCRKLALKQKQIPILHKSRVLRCGKKKKNDWIFFKQNPVSFWLLVVLSSKLGLGSIKIPLWWCCVRTLARPILCWTPDVGGLVHRLRFNSLRCDFGTSTLTPWVWINVSGWLLARSLNYVRAGWHGITNVSFPTEFLGRKSFQQYVEWFKVGRKLIING